MAREFYRCASLGSVVQRESSQEEHGHGTPRGRWGPPGYALKKYPGFGQAALLTMYIQLLTSHAPRPDIAESPIGKHVLHVR